MVYVNQGEFASFFYRPEGNAETASSLLPEWVGSGDATSCHIVFLSTSDRLVIGHLDRGNLDTFFDVGRHPTSPLGFLLEPTFSTVASESTPPPINVSSSLVIIFSCIFSSIINIYPSSAQLVRNL
ncbi:unnamed protein product [Protopolystoma xenopodis]|uniref:Uncharacterized protein n=1 Tax=Protopolystoma xenopodis TaxID=117903 RepID=A0A3S4ZI31_9PLAT|nr:unnamed protein product [Protopolystoma xenopodis]